MKRYVFATMLFASMVVSLPSAAQQMSIGVGGKVCPDGQILVKGTCVARCSEKTEYLAGKECTVCPANAVCNGRTATCKKNMVTIHQDGKIVCKRSPVATVQNGKVKKQCRQESHIGIDWIKSRYKNCVKCGTINIAAKKCPNNPKPHRHYYCDCAC